MSAPRSGEPPVVGISLGDPTGIGPEIVVRALHARPDLAVRVYGDPRVLSATANRLRLPSLPAHRVHAVSDASDGDFVPGRPNLASARAQLA